MWDLYQSSKQWKVRPSAMMGLDPVHDSYKAYCLDQACSMWGNFVMAELDKIEGKDGKSTSRKRHQKLLKILDAPAEQRFKSLAPMEGVKEPRKLKTQKTTATK